MVSESRKRAEDDIPDRRRHSFEAAKLHDGLSAKGRLKRYDKVLESGLEQRFSTVAQHYEITVEKAGANATAVRFSHRRQDNAGACVLRTSDRDIETVLGAYWRITDIEATFRSLKSELGLRPIQLDQRITSHLLIAVLHAVHLIRWPRGASTSAGHRSARACGAGSGSPRACARRIDRQPTGHAPDRRGRRNLLGGWCRTRRTRSRLTS